MWKTMNRCDCFLPWPALPSPSVWAARSIGSPGWTRTTNPPVNSRMLCQLSYRGLLGVREDIGAERVLTLAYRRTHAQPDRPPAGRRMVVAMGQDGCTPTNLER